MNKLWIKGLAMTAAIATIAVAIWTPLAGADNGAKSRIVIKGLSAGGAAGKVSSGRSACLARRKVSLFLYDGFITDKIAITHTNSGGQWRVDRRLKPGRYFAKVDSKAGCRYDNSKAKRLG